MVRDVLILCAAGMLVSAFLMVGQKALFTAIRLYAAQSLLLGTVARTMFNALQVAGTVMAQQAGLGLIIPASIEPEGVSALAQFLLFGAISLIFALGLDLQLLLAIRDSYALFPLGELPDPGGMALHVTRTVGTAFSLGIRLSLPFLLIGFTLYVGLGVINRAMPQMMVFFVAALISLSPVRQRPQLDDPQATSGSPRPARQTG